jgi:biotin operon repressor
MEKNFVNAQKMRKTPLKEENLKVISSLLNNNRVAIWKVMQTLNTV